MRIVAIDIGSSTMKVSRQMTDGSLNTERVSHTPQTPRAILTSVENLIAESGADVIALSCFRRALVVDEYNLIFARSSPTHPVVFVDNVLDGVDLRNRLAPIHRWKHAGGYGSIGAFRTLDGWLSERLTGKNALAESQAWLTGAWDTDLLTWDSAVLACSGIEPADLPEVLMTPEIVGGICLPVLGDHEATAFAAFNLGQWPLRLLECGTAFAGLLGQAAAAPVGLGVESARRCGYSELIDPLFSLRMIEGHADTPEWMPSHPVASTESLLTGALASVGIASGQVWLCGGNAKPEFVDALIASGYDAIIIKELTSGVGALQLAEKCMGSVP